MDTILKSLSLALLQLSVVLTAAPKVYTVDNLHDAQTISHIEEKDLPEVLLIVAQCESGGKQFTPSGSVVRGDKNKHDIGEFQINELYHKAQAEKLGMDIYTEQGNRDYAYWLYTHGGTKFWNWSKKCWSK